MDLNRDIEGFSLVIFDLETTGLDAVTGDSICEIGAFKVKGRKIVDKFHSLINPARSMPPQAYDVHRICEEELKGAPYFEEIADKFIAFLEDCVVLAYNIKFDLGFINQSLKRMNRQRLEIPSIDILSMARDALKLPRYNLEAVAKFLGVDCSRGLHRALGDTAIAYEVFLKLVDTFKAKGITELGDFISLYGLNNEIFKSKEDQKIHLFKQAAERGISLGISYFSSANRLEKEEVMPLRVFDEDKCPYLLYRGRGEGSSSIKLCRILKVGTPASN